MARPTLSPSSSMSHHHNHTNSISTSAQSQPADNIQYIDLPLPPPPESLPLPAANLQALLHSIHPSLSLETNLEQLLQELANDFIDDLCRKSCQLAKHRMSSTLDVKDIQLYLQKQYGISVPYEPAQSTTNNATTNATADSATTSAAASKMVTLKPIQRPRVVEAHRRRLALIARSRQRDVLRKNRPAAKRSAANASSNRNAADTET